MAFFFPPIENDNAKHSMETFFQRTELWVRFASILPSEPTLPPIAVCDTCLTPVSNEKELSKSKKCQGGSDGTRPVLKAELEGHLPGLLLSAGLLSSNCCRQRNIWS